MIIFRDNNSRVVLDFPGTGMSEGKSGICFKLGRRNEKAPSVEGNVIVLKDERIQNGNKEGENKRSRI
jgi:hypothetical protein